MAGIVYRQLVWGFDGCGGFIKILTFFLLSRVFSREDMATAFSI